MSIGRSQSGVLLDTCAVIWLANGDPMAPDALAAIQHAGGDGGVFVSPISAWEVGLLSRPRPPRRPAVSFLPDVRTWFSRFMAAPGIRDAPLLAEIAIASADLPGDLHGDPADRMIVATARHFAMPIVTRDRRILAYGQAGHVGTIAC